MAYAIELLNGGSLHCGFWYYPITDRGNGQEEGRDVPFSSPLNSTNNPPLVFKTRTEAEVAVEFYDSVWSDSHIEAAPKEVNVDPTHELTDEGFAATPMKNSLFSQ